MTSKQFVVALCGVAAFAVNVSHAADKPNIIYILADDLGYGDLGCFGQKKILTPNIDQLCAKGMKFTNHHSGSTVCAPSRAVLLTGKHTGHCTVRGNGSKHNLRDGHEDVTIAEVLKGAGYHTAMIGKAGTGCNVSPGQPNRKGFDYFYGFNGHGPAHHYFPPVVYRNEREIHFAKNKNHTGDTYIHDEFMREVMHYLDEHGKTERPFFLHYAAMIPHASLVAPEEWVAKYRGKVKEEKQVSRGNYARCDEPKATFAGMVSRLDWEVGEIMSKLDDLGVAENTLVIFTSDNGPHSAGGNKAEWFNSNGILRGEKRDLFEGGVRVPMIAHWQGRIEAGSTTDHLSAFWDVMPTLCELAEMESPLGIDGISFLPTLLGKSDQQKQHEYLYWEFYERGGKRAALTHKWKAVQLNMNNGGDSIRLFDINADPTEQYDVAKNHPEVVANFRSIFDQAHTSSPLIQWRKR
ncbi:arylsulfatase [Rhodopirellula sallentina]|uniref:arylsulfatase n=1 Tax=Rhodopirellula sallentina TaxID=1263869 RepID=UPI0005C7CBE6|nr:arylsulfatase [Rhodopirellula sallentina]